jgi:hypothetical protein
MWKGASHLKGYQLSISPNRALFSTSLVHPKMMRLPLISCKRCSSDKKLKDHVMSISPSGQILGYVAELKEEVEPKKKAEREIYEKAKVIDLEDINWNEVTGMDKAQGNWLFSQAVGLSVCANSKEQFIESDIPEVEYLSLFMLFYFQIAFIGRSNVGKSSLLNSLLKAHGLAKVSKTPVCSYLLQWLRIRSTGKNSNN